MQSITEIDSDDLEKILKQINQAVKNAGIDTIFHEFAVIAKDADGKTKLITGLIPKGFNPTISKVEVNQ
ncbi:MAG: hypothetical protein DRI32_08800 [Chloroflexi bacterium]|nr:MAG: hypothetical protein DRI32_08800 [Chloroflexota bacterium]